MSVLAARRTLETDWQDLTVEIAPAFTLESGDVLSDGRVQLRRHGRADGPQIVALGGISAHRALSGEGGWWSQCVAAGGPIDTERYGVIGVDFAPLSEERVRITPHDQARLLIAALDRLGLARLHAFVGASYGAMVGLALAELAPQRLERLIAISASHKPSALGLAWRGVQRRIVEFALSHGDEAGGLALARQLAMTTYRTGEEFEARFGAGVDQSGRGKVDRYLIARGEAYRAAMPARRWLSLSEAIDRHGVDPAAISTPVTLIACIGDQVIPFADVEELSRRLANLRALHPIASIYGHDAFLKEADALRPLIRTALEAPAHV